MWILLGIKLNFISKLLPINGINIIGAERQNRLNAVSITALWPAFLDLPYSTMPDSFRIIMPSFNSFCHIIQQFTVFEQAAEKKFRKVLANISLEPLRVNKVLAK